MDEVFEDDPPPQQHVEAATENGLPKPGPCLPSHPA
jgi:hypothetical protein